MDLLPSEQLAADFVRNIGIKRAERILNALGRRFDRRYQQACAECPVPINREWIKRTDLEVDLSHKLKIGISLVDDYHTPAAARERILARIAKRNLKKWALTNGYSTQVNGG